MCTFSVVPRPVGQSTNVFCIDSRLLSSHTKPRGFETRFDNSNKFCTHMLRVRQKAAYSLHENAAVSEPQLLNNSQMRFKLYDGLRARLPVKSKMSLYLIDQNTG